MKEFKEVFNKNHRPLINELDTFFLKDVGLLFHDFADFLLKEYSLSFAIPTWSEESGWVYKIGWSGIFLITDIVITENSFQVLGMPVTDKDSYNQLLQKVDELYKEEKDDFLARIAQKNKIQKEKNTLRVQREKLEREALKDRINPEKYNCFKWPDKLNVTKLRRLYLEDAKGLKNEELADEIGYCLYIRCKSGKDDMDIMEQYKIRCHNCGKVLDSNEDFRECSCGNQYSYKEYRRNYRRNNMPTGAASAIFNEFAQMWPTYKTYEEKMIAIDKLLHEFHLNLVSGAVHRPVAMNFIDGTRERIEKIILELAL